MDFNPYEAPRSERHDRSALSRLDRGTASAVVAALATLVLLFTATHIRVDHSWRVPRVTWTWPAGEWTGYLAGLAWLSNVVVVAWLLGTRAPQASMRERVLAAVGLILTIANVLGGCLLFGDASKT